MHLRYITDEINEASLTGKNKYNNTAIIHHFHTFTDVELSKMLDLVQQDKVEKLMSEEKMATVLLEVHASFFCTSGSLPVC